MRATGIVRRIDELGRIVIPKEIRQKLRIKDGENIEIFVEQEKIILSKYSDLSNVKDICEKVVQSLSSIIKNNIIICDTQKIVTANKSSFIDKKIDIESCLHTNEGKIEDNSFIETANNKYNYSIYKITSNGDFRGLLIFLKEESITKEDKMVLNLASNFLSKYLEE